MSEYGAHRYTEFLGLGLGGTFGRIVLAKDNLNGRDVAIKQIERGTTVDKYVLNEILNLRLLNHPHITEFIECYLTETHLCIVMEYVAGGNLKDFIRTRNGINQDSARWFFQQLIIAVDYCHKKRVIDRDIKLENVLVESDSEHPLLKLCDFGFSKNETANSAARSSVGRELVSIWHLRYLQQKEMWNMMERLKADIWSCGVLLYAMIFNCFPFIRTEDVNCPNEFERIAMKVINEPLNFPVHDQSLEDVQDLLTKILKKDPDRRITIAQIMEHRWFSIHLPEGSLDMNNELESKPCGYQTKEEIRELFEQAKTIVKTENDQPHSNAV
eukprot:g3175.t1